MWRLQYDDKALVRNLSDLERKQLPFATMLALNDAMFGVVNAWKEAIPQVFDRPTPFTLNSVLYKKATKDRLYAEVWLRDEIRDGTPPARYLHREATGGAREEKPLEHLLRQAGVLTSDEFIVPARGFPLDQFGNVPGAVARNILADLQASRDEKDRSTAESRGKRARRRDIGKRAVYFESVPTRGRSHGRKQHLPRAIFQRTATGFGSSIRMAFVIVKGPPRYRQRFDAQRFAQKAFSEAFPRAFHTRLRNAVATAKVR